MHMNTLSTLLDPVSISWTLSYIANKFTTFILLKHIYPNTLNNLLTNSWWALGRTGYPKDQIIICIVTYNRTGEDNVLSDSKLIFIIVLPLIIGDCTIRKTIDVYMLKSRRLIVYHYAVITFPVQHKYTSG